MVLDAGASSPPPPSSKKSYLWHKRLKKKHKQAIFLMTKHNKQICRVSPFFELQNDTQQFNSSGSSSSSSGTLTGESEGNGHRLKLPEPALRGLGGVAPGYGRRVAVVQVEHPHQVRRVAAVHHPRPATNNSLLRAGIQKGAPNSPDSFLTPLQTTWSLTWKKCLLGCSKGEILINFQYDFYSPTAFRMVKVTQIA